MSSDQEMSHLGAITWRKAAPCSLLLLVPPTTVLPLTQHSYSEMFEKDLLQKFHSLS